MNIQQQLLYLDKSYTIISAEHEFVIHPIAFDILPLTLSSAECSFASSFQVINNCLLLKSLSIFKDETTSFTAEPADMIEEPYIFHDKPISYSGTILIGDVPIKEYIMKEYIMKESRTTIFSYKSVYELIFEDGNLITTIDHSKAMLRIRKNIELGLRSLTNKWDVRCIFHFMKSTFIGDYRTFSSAKKRLKYLKEMKSSYQYSNI